LFLAKQTNPLPKDHRDVPSEGHWDGVKAEGKPFDFAQGRRCALRAANVGAEYFAKTTRNE
jgi:hypothetical protein